MLLGHTTAKASVAWACRWAGMAAHACNDGRDLIPRIAAGDRVALAQLYDRYAASVLGLAYRILGHQATAETVVLDVFHEVWRTAAHYDPTRSAPDTWLFTLARMRASTRRAAWGREAGGRSAPPTAGAPLASRGRPRSAPGS